MRALPVRWAGGDLEGEQVGWCNVLLGVAKSPVYYRHDCVQIQKMEGEESPTVSGRARWRAHSDRKLETEEVGCEL